MQLIGPADRLVEKHGFTVSDVYYLLKLCYNYAGKNSDDRSNQNAALIVPCDAQHPQNLACNRLPPGVIKTDERILQRPMKYAFIEHAERIAIYKAARDGFPLAGATMFCPWFACADCARAIVCSGITTVVGHKQRMEATSLNRDKVKDTVDNRWTAPVSDGDTILNEAGIEIIYLDGTIDDISILVNEQLMTAI